MQFIWFKGHTLNKESKEKRKREVLSYRNAFDELTILLKDMEENNVSNDYSSPSWAYVQADRNGANRMLRKIIEIINIKE